MKKETLAESIAKYLAKGGKIVICPPAPYKKSPTYGRGTVSWAGRKSVNLHTGTRA